MGKRKVGFVRKIDTLGRVVVPMEIRAALKIQDGEQLEFEVSGTDLILKKHVDTCIFCGEIEQVKKLDETAICKVCRDKIVQMED